MDYKEKGRSMKMRRQVRCTTAKKDSNRHLLRMSKLSLYRKLFPDRFNRTGLRFRPILSIPMSSHHVRYIGNLASLQLFGQCNHWAFTWTSLDWFSTPQYPHWRHCLRSVTSQTTTRRIYAFVRTAPQHIET